MGFLADFLGASPPIDALRDRVSQLLAHERRSGRLPPILIEGETGTGKGLLARLIHQHGGRAAGPFVAVNCAAIPEPLLEAELFGYERGAFTDAQKAKPGLFQAAHQGTLFLDEIALLSPGAQAKVLVAVEERTVRRLGSTRSEVVDARVVAATNADLAAAVRARQFREDLYHRLAVVTLTLPALRGRPDDIVQLAEHFLARTCADYALSPKRFSADAKTALRGYAWPGNVRQLSNVVERVALLVDRSLITAEVLGLPRATSASGSSDIETAGSGGPKADGASAGVAGSLDVDLARAERERVLDALGYAGWNITQAADRLGIARHRLRHLIDKHRLARPGARQGPPATSAESPPTARSPEASPLGSQVAAPHEATGAAHRADPIVARREPSERRHLAFLRCDLVAPASAGETVDRHWALSAVTEKLESFGGQVEPVGPWALVATFGLIPVENAPVCAALAALATQKSAARNRRLDPAVPEVRCALHASHVTAEGYRRDRIDGGEKQAAYAFIAGLAGLATADAFLVSQAAAPFLERRFELVKAWPPQEGWPTPVYLIKGLEATGFGLGGRPLSRFVGRERELGLLDDRLTQAERAHGQVVSLVGDPGVGKSRFVFELSRAGRLAGWRVLHGAAPAAGTAPPSLPIVELLRPYLGVDEASPSSEIREKLAACASRLGDDSLVAPLAALLDAADAEWQRLDPLSRRQRIVSAVVRLLVAESEAQPVLIVVEDVQWSDSETQATLDALVARLPAARVLLIVTHRPDFVGTWASRTYWSQLRLDVLDGDHAAEMLTALLGGHPSLEPVKRQLVATTEGNPLFLEECVRALVEAGTLDGEPGAYRPAADLQGLRVPATVQAVLDARIRRLPPEARALLQRAAAIGRDVSVRLLGAIAGLAEEAFERALHHLQDAEFLYEAPPRADRAYTFKHALIQDAAHATLSAEERQRTHAGLVYAIETLYADRLGEQTERLGHHARHGHLWEKAVHYQRLAGIRALERAAILEAVGALDLALLALGRLPTTPDRQALGIDLRLELRPAYHALGKFGRIHEVLREAEQLALALDDQRRWARVRAELTEFFCVMGPLQDGLDCARDALRVAEMLGDPDLEILANMRLGQVSYLLGNYRQSIAFCTTAVECLRKRGTRWEYQLLAVHGAATRLHLTLASGALGRFENGQAFAEEGARIARAADQPYSRAIAGLGVGALSLQRGDLESAAPPLEEALGLCRIAELRHLSIALSLMLARTYAQSGRLDEAERLCVEGLESVRRLGVAIGRSSGLATLADVLSRSGRDAEALELAEEALKLARTHAERGWEALALHTMAEVHSRRRPLDVEVAATWYRQARALGSDLAMRPLVAHAHLGLGTLYARVGRHQQAIEELASATALYRDMDTPLWLRKSEAALEAMVTNVDRGREHEP